MATNPLLVVHMDGSPGSTVFTDASGNGRNITSFTGVGPPTNTVVSSNSYFGNGSLFVSGGNFDGLAVDPSSDFNFGTGTWTIDFWANFSTIAGNMTLASIGGSNVVGYLNSGGFGLYFADQPGTHVFGNNFVPTIGVWYHIAFQKDNAGNIWGYVNGVQNTGGPSSQLIGNSTVGPGIGNNNGAGSPFTGYIDEFRISNTAIFTTAGFTPPTSPWPYTYSWPTTTKWNVS